MRCPKCGSFLEEGKDICFMCGTNIKTYDPSMDNQMSNSNQFNSDPNFSTGFNNVGNSNFNNNNVQTATGLPQSYYDRAKNNQTQNSKKKKDTDIIDFYQSHKSIVLLIILIIVLAIICLIGYNYYKKKNVEPTKEAIIGELYYIIDDGFEDVSTNSAKIYTLSGAKGSDCSINISYASTTSEDYVTEYFGTIETNLTPELDESGNVVDEMDVYKSQQSSSEINGQTWYYLNIFYRKDKTSEEYNSLKYRYLAIVHKGYSYSIVLTNNSSSSACNTALDSFASSLEFVENNE